LELNIGLKDLIFFSRLLSAFIPVFLFLLHLISEFAKIATDIHAHSANTQSITLPIREQASKIRKATPERDWLNMSFTAIFTLNFSLISFSVDRDSENN